MCKVMLLRVVNWCYMSKRWDVLKRRGRGLLSADD